MESNNRQGIVRVAVKGFTSLGEVEFYPGRLTVLIGANGSGKSNILKALRLVSLLQTQSLQRFVGDEGGASTLLHYGPKVTRVMEIELEFRQNHQRNRYRARLGYAAGDTLVFADESIGHRDEERGENEFSWVSLGTGHRESLLREKKNESSTHREVNHWLSQITFYHFHDTSVSSALRTHSRTEDNLFLRSDGSNLAAYLLRLAESEDEAESIAWKRINKLVRKVAPCIKELAPVPVNRMGSSVRLDWIDDKDERFGVHQLSDGTLRAIALVTALAQPTAHLPRFISIDEPELGLHPSAIALIAELARSASRHTQILFATQSTTFLNHFASEEVVVTERVNGNTQLKRLNPSELSEWLDEYTLSDIFSKGVIGGQP